MSPAPTGEDTKDVYAHFGLAMYYAQVLEHALANALVVADLMPVWIAERRAVDDWAPAFDAFQERQFNATLGVLIRRLKSVTEVPPGLGSMLTNALHKRNWLAHHYFRERAETFVIHEGRARMVDELVEAQEAFTRTDEALGAVIDTLIEEVGLDKDRLQAAEAEYLASVERD